MSLFKKILLLCLLLLLTKGFSRPVNKETIHNKKNLRVHALDENIDLTPLSEEFKKYPYKPIEIETYISSEKCYEILKQEKIEIALSWDEDQVFIFYRSILKTPYKYLKAKYPFLTTEKYQILFKRFREER